MNTGQFNSSQFNESGLRLIIELVLTITHSIVMFPKKVRAFGVSISNTVQFIRSELLELSINIATTTKRLIGKVFDYGILLSMNKTALAIRHFNYVVNVVVNILFNKIMELGINIAFGITKITQAVKSMTINILYTKIFFIQRLYNFTMNISGAVKKKGMLISNFVVSIAMDFVTNVRYIYLYWRKQLNPDIIGFKILQSNSPYGTYTQIATTTNSHYVKQFLGGTKWIKVIPYTSRGDLKYVLFKGVKYG